MTMMPLLSYESSPVPAVSVTLTVMSPGGVAGSGVSSMISGTRTGVPAVPWSVAGAATLGRTPADDAATKLMTFPELTTGVRPLRLPVRLKVSGPPADRVTVNVEPA